MSNFHRAECFLFSGLAAAGSRRGTRALEKLIDELPLEVDAKHQTHRKWTNVLDGILARHIRFGPALVLLIGHSYGALRCQQIAGNLNERGITVSYIAGIDPTALPRRHTPMKITPNVELVDEFHAVSGPPAARRKSDPSGKGGGRFIIPEVMHDRHYLEEVPYPHIRSARSEEVRERILSKISEILG